MWQRASNGGGGGGGAEIKQGTVTSTSSGATINTGLSDMDVFIYDIPYTVKLCGCWAKSSSFSSTTNEVNVCYNGNSLYNNSLVVNGDTVTIPANMTGTGRTVNWVAIKYT